MLNLSQTLIIGALLGLTACGPSGLPPVEAPSGWSSDKEVLSIVQDRTAVVERNPSSAKAHRSLGLAFSANQVWGPASHCFDNTLTLDPRDMEAKYELALTLANTGELDRMLEVLTELVEEQEDHLAGRQTLAIELLKRDDLDAAQAHFQWLEDYDSKGFLGMLGLGEVALARGDAEQAEELFLTARKRAPKNLYITFVLGQTYLDLDQEEKAKPLLGVGAGQDRPRYPSALANEKSTYSVGFGARLNVAVALMNAGENARAIEQFEYLQTLDATNEACLINLASAYLLVNRHEDSLATVDKVLSLNPDSMEALANKGTCLMSMAKLRKSEGKNALADSLLIRALEAVDKGLAESDRAGRAHSLRGQILQLMGRVPEAVKSLKSGILNGDDREKIHLLLARLSGSGGNMAAAEKILRESVEVSGLRLESKFQLCGILLQTGRGEEARAIQKRMDALVENHPKTQMLDKLLKERGY